MVTARMEQKRVNLVVQLIFDPSLGSPVAVSKAIQGMRGVEMGPVRLPNAPLDEEKLAFIRAKLTALDFFSWCE